MSRNETADARFREAFRRLKEGAPQVLEKGALPSQNNVAKEAGKHPSALRKERYPELVAEIQAYCEQLLGPQSETSGKSSEVDRLKAHLESLKAKQQLEASRVLSLLMELHQLRKALLERKRGAEV